MAQDEDNNTTAQQNAEYVQLTDEPVQPTGGQEAPRTTTPSKSSYPSISQGAIPKSTPRPGAMSWTVRTPDFQKRDMEELARSNYTETQNSAARNCKDADPLEEDGPYAMLMIAAVEKVLQQTEKGLSHAILRVSDQMRKDPGEKNIDVRAAMLLEGGDEKLYKIPWEKELAIIEKTCGTNAPLRNLLPDIIKASEDSLYVNIDFLTALLKEKTKQSQSMDLAKQITGKQKPNLMESVRKILKYDPLLDHSKHSNLDQLIHRMQRMDEKISDLKSTQAGLLACTDCLGEDLAEARKLALTHPFRLMEFVLRIDCINRELWKPLSPHTRTETVKKALILLGGMEESTEVELWALKDTTRTINGVKVTFKDIDTRYKVESALSQTRAAGRTMDGMSFASTRMPPLEFTRDRNALEDFAKNKLTKDWIEIIGEGRHKYKDTHDEVRRCLRIRTKWKVKPRLTIWIEVQDPCHRYVWSTVDYSANHFKDYDFNAQVPCPTTRRASRTNSKWLVPRFVKPEADIKRVARKERPSSTTELQTAQTPATTMPTPGAGTPDEHLLGEATGITIPPTPTPLSPTQPRGKGMETRSRSREKEDDDAKDNTVPLAQRNNKKSKKAAK